MSLTLTMTLENERTLLDIEDLRGDLKAEEFAFKCFVDGLRLARTRKALRKVPRSPDGGVCLGQVEPRFRGLDKDTVVRVLRNADDNNPVYVEVRNLVQDYRRILELDHKETGRDLTLAQVAALVPIQQVALELALKSLSNGERAFVREVTKH